ncbi:MAG: polysaccharide deacetylase [Clostridia bacterium]|nr:polysaccharide deacetylase [Clostridia bacterium]
MYLLRVEAIDNTRKAKKLLVAIIILTLLLLFLCLFIVLQKYVEHKYISSLDHQVSKAIEEINKINEERITKELEEKRKTPNLTENGLNAIKNIYNLKEEKEVYLTFDDGPSKTVTPLILDVLKENNIKATFFVLGSRVELNPELVKRAYDEGHYIANHGYSHVYKNIYKSKEKVLNEYNKTEQAIKLALGKENYNSHLFRFPGGSTGGKYHNLKQETILMLEQNNIATLDWNCLSGDSAGAITKEELLQNVINTSIDKSSIVVLMHDAGDKILTYETLQDIINYFRQQGYVFKDMYDIIN